MTDSSRSISYDFFTNAVKKATATKLIIFLNFISWCLITWLSSIPLLKEHNSKLLLNFGGINGELLFGGEYWRILVSQFLHVYFAHFIFNMVALYLLGSDFEQKKGTLRFLILFICSGSAGQFMSVISAPTLVSSGSSQAVLGIAGAQIIQLIQSSKNEKSLIIILVLVIGIQILLDLMTAQTVKAGHWASLLFGALIGYFFANYNKINK